MKIGHIFVKRPVMTTMVFFGVVLFGAIAWLRLPQELFPNISVPQLVILTKYANAAPEEIENLITKPIEEAVGTVPNLKRIKSISKEGLSAVMLEFAWGTDMGFAHLSTREKIDRMKDRLPVETEESIIKRVNPFSHPVMIISVTGELELADMTDLCNDVIQKKLEKTDGVASATISGGQKREILVEIDRGRLEASKISLPMVVDALKNANYDYPAGVTQGKVVEYLVRTHGRFTNIEDIGKTIVQVENPEFDPVYKWKTREGRDHGGAPTEQRLIALRDLSDIQLGLQEKTSYSRYNGKENISISIQKQAEANTVAVARAVKKSLDELRGSLPSSVRLNVVYDESSYIRAALNNMATNIAVGGLLAFLVLFYFLGDLRESINMGVAIPIAVLAVLIFMWMTGLSVNMLTLAGIALAVGTLTDCSTCVAENIDRHRKQIGKSMIDSAVDGSDEMAVSMISASLTNVAVFLPLLFISGIAQRLFQDLFLVTVYTNIASLLIALTLIPRMAAYEWRLPNFVRRIPLFRYRLTDEGRKKITEKYEKILTGVLHRPRLVLEVLAFLAGIGIFVLFLTHRVFMPRMDQGQFIVQLTMPIGTRLEATNAVANKLENILLSREGLRVMVNVGSAQEEEDIDALDAHEAQLVVALDPSKGLVTDQVIERFKTAAANENLEGGHLTYLLQDSPLRAALAGGAPIEVEVKGPDLPRLNYISNELVKKFTADPELFGVKTTFALPSRETQVVVDKDRAAGFQLSVADIARAALIAIRGLVATTFKEGGKETDIRVRLRAADRDDNESIRRLALRSPQGTMIPLDAVAQIRSGVGTSEIRHIDQQRSVVVTAEVTGSVDEALERVRQMIQPYRGYKDYTVELGGESRRMAESFGSLKYTFLLAILLVYMIMAAEFESLVQPFIIMSTVPLAFIGVAITLFLTNTPLSSVAVLGLVILAGIVVNNGIVLIDHINLLREQGRPLFEAVVEGSGNRLRPILMTTATTLLGVLPMAVGIGRGDELAQPLAVVTFGGLFLSTCLTLIVIPLIYYRLGKKESGASRR